MQVSEFDDIRPYRDDEFRKVVRRIISRRWIIKALRKYAWPRCPLILRPPVHWILRLWLKFKLLPIRTIDDFHFKIMRPYILEWTESGTTSGVSAAGTEHIPRDRSVLYVTNHRDIVLDSAFLCMILMDLGLRTQEIAFGSNLMINALTTDLIRINKSFIVKRNLSVREQIKESIKLSRYIEYTLGLGNSVWLAQREGRAKDGDDRTNPSIIKMLYLSQRKGGKPFSDFINGLRIIPVSISYEFDPCDYMKAREIYSLRTKGTYQKREKEDLLSIVKGISGFKGRIQYTFNPHLSGEWQDAQDVSSFIDKQIHASYKMWPSNYIAYDTLYSVEKYKNCYTQEDKDVFLRRFRTLSPGLRDIALEIYARPVKNKEDIGEEI